MNKRTIVRRRQLAVALLALLACSSAAAQTRYTSAVIKQNTYPTPEAYQRPIRNWNKNYSVGVVGDSTTIGLALINHSDFFSTPTATGPACSEIIAHPPVYFTDTNITVSDIYIVDDIAFFCGYYRIGPYTNQAIFGHINLQNLLAGTAPLHYGYATGVERLHKLVAFKDYTGYRIIAIGDDIDSTAPGSVYTKEKIVDIENVLGSAPIGINIYSLSANSFYDKEYLYDVMLTEDFIVFTGHYYTGGHDEVHFRMAEKGPLLATPMLHTVHLLGAPGEANANVAATALVDNQIALAYVYEDQMNIQFYDRMRVIDLNTLSNTISQQLWRQDKIYPTMMDYIAEYKKVVMLQPYKNPVDFILWEPFKTTAYTLNILTPPTGLLYRHVHSLVNKGFISSCGPLIYLQDAAATMPASSPTCPASISAPVKHIENLPIVKISDPRPISYNISIPSSYFSISVDSLTNSCFSEE